MIVTSVINTVKSLLFIVYFLPSIHSVRAITLIELTDQHDSKDVHMMSIVCVDTAPNDMEEILLSQLPF